MTSALTSPPFENCFQVLKLNEESPKSELVPFLFLACPNLRSLGEINLAAGLKAMYSLEASGSSSELHPRFASAPPITAPNLVEAKLEAATPVSGRVDWAPARYRADVAASATWLYQTEERDCLGAIPNDGTANLIYDSILISGELCSVAKLK